eukprot:scaffold26180_cov171-Cylindrotheca_fusiformis.AAC.1
MVSGSSSPRSSKFSVPITRPTHGSKGVGAIVEGVGAIVEGVGAIVEGVGAIVRGVGAIVGIPPPALFLVLLVGLVGMV